MKISLPVMKLHGCGNSFIIVRQSDIPISIDLRNLSIFLCSHAFGIGSDGLMVVCPYTGGPTSVIMLNPDGSPMGMCGNGIRCVTRFLFDTRQVPPLTTEILYEVSGRMIQCSTFDQGSTVTVNMGAPQFLPEQIPISTREQQLHYSLEVEGKEVKLCAVSMGNPHAVIFAEEDTTIGTLQALENHPFFPERVNVEWVQVKDSSSASVLMWERGAGRTLACGTAACAVLVAGVRTGRFNSSIALDFEGGRLNVSWPDGGDVFLSGPTEIVLKGEVDISPIA